MAGNELAWPGTDTVITVDDAGTWTSNLSGLEYQPATASDPAVLWAIQNGPSKLYRLLWNGTTHLGVGHRQQLGRRQDHPLPERARAIPTRRESPRRSSRTTSIYVSTERDNDANTINRFSVLRYDTTAAGTDLTALNDWELTADLPATGINLGLEAITYVPDTALVAGRFFDEAANAAYDPARYPNHGTGLFFVGPRVERHHLRIRAQPRRQHLHARRDLRERPGRHHGSLVRPRGRLPVGPVRQHVRQQGHRLPPRHRLDVAHRRPLHRSAAFSIARTRCRTRTSRASASRQRQSASAARSTSSGPTTTRSTCTRSAGAPSPAARSSRPISTRGERSRRQAPYLPRAKRGGGRHR